MDNVEWREDARLDPIIKTGGEPEDQYEPISHNRNMPSIQGFMLFTGVNRRLTTQQLGPVTPNKHTGVPAQREQQSQMAGANAPGVDNVKTGVPNLCSPLLWTP